MPRGVWGGTLSFGLVAVPVRMVSATRDRDVHFHQVDGESGERIEVRRLAEADGEEVPWEEVGRGYELDGTLVTFSDEELAAAAPERTHTIEIEQFVDLAAIDPAQFDHPYFLVPDSDSNGALRAYRLLRDAMKETGQVAIGRVVIRANEYLVAVRERDGLLSLTTLLFADELRGAEEIEAVPSVEAGAPARAELTAAVRLIDAMTREFDPAAYEDLHRERLLALVQRKSSAGAGGGAGGAGAGGAGGGEGAGSGEGEAPTGGQPPAPDLIAALKESLARVRAS